ncbi:MAG TPA: tol-pal system-associated acyl-CoA thioesterase [Caulobacteraceae bacterium]|jgi:acyl-CoA thioester hydrolase|nr:tol-pal system-associated acyl-CoA thioesterase [Caulobacteraceae bacterium]
MESPAPIAGVIQDGEHLLPVRVYYEDTDFTGVVYHANYLRYFERGRSDFLRLRGISHTELRARQTPIAFVVRRMEIDFAKAARIDDALVVRTVYEALQGARVRIRQRIERDGEIIASAAVEVACIRLDGRPVKPPRDIVAALSL